MSSVAYDLPQDPICKQADVKRRAEPRMFPSGWQGGYPSMGHALCGQPLVLCRQVWWPSKAAHPKVTLDIHFKHSSTFAIEFFDCFLFSSLRKDTDAGKST